jgi:Tfp pilus assembly protein PilF
VKLFEIFSGSRFICRHGAKNSVKSSGWPSNLTGLKKGECMGGSVRHGVMLACLLWLLSAQAVFAAATLKGVVMRERESGSPMAGVLVSADGAKPVRSDRDGRFQLFFPQREVGQDVTLRVRHPGWVAVNRVLLEHQILTSDEQPFAILLCQKGEFEKWERLFYRLAIDKIVLQEFQKRVAELEQRTGQGDAALRQQKQSLIEQKDQAHKQAEELLQQLMSSQSVRESDSFTEARRLFLEGKLDLALSRLNEARLERESLAARSKAEQAGQAWLLRAKLLVLRFDLQGAARAYGKAVEVASGSFDIWFQFGVFHQHQNHYMEAQRGYYRTLPLAREAGNLVHVASVLNNLGNLYRDENRTVQAREAYDEALAIYRALARGKPDLYLPYMATILNNIGILESTENRKTEARLAYDEALAIDRQLALKRPDRYLGVVASTLNNLGILHSDESRRGEARLAYDEALKINRRMALQEPDQYLPAVAVTLNNLGNLHSDESRNAEARAAYDEALAIYRRLARQNPEVYLPDIATTLNNLGILYRENQDADKASKAYDEALGIRRKLAERNPEVYLPTVAEILNNLGSLLSAERRFTDARAAYDEALQIYRHFAQLAPNTYSLVLQRVEYNRSLLPGEEGKPL